MAEDQKKDEAGTQSTSESPQTAGGGARSLEDLKAKLGIATRPKPAAEAPLRKRTTETDFDFSLNAPAEAAPVLREPSEVSAMVVQKKGLSTPWIVGFSVIAVLALVLGLFFGKVMKERAIENFKTKEAAFFLEYFRTTRSEKMMAGEGNTLDLIKAHVEDTQAVFTAMQKAATPEAQEAAMRQLDQYLERCQAYRDRQPVFSVEAVFPGVIFNQELAVRVVRYIQAVQRLHDETALLALEADTLRRVTELEERGQAIETVLIEPVEENGERWQKGTFIARIDREHPTRKNGDVEYPVLPVGAEKGVLAPTTALVKVDVAPIAQSKSARYRAAIQARVRARLAKVKEAADLANFAGLEEQITKVASRPPLFTIF